MPSQTKLAQLIARWHGLTIVGEQDEEQLRQWADRGLTMEQMVHDFLAPPNDDSKKEYLEYLCEILAVEPSTPVSEALLIPAWKY